MTESMQKIKAIVFDKGICKTRMLGLDKQIKNLIFLFFIFGQLSLLLYGQEMRVSELILVGTERINPNSLEKLIGMKKEMDLDSLLMDQDITRLKRLPSVANAYYEVYQDLDEAYRISYLIEENYTLIPAANLFTSTNDDFAFRIGLQYGHTVIWPYDDITI